VGDQTDCQYHLTPREACEALRRGFDRACRHRPASCFDVALAGAKVRLRIPDPAIEALFRACYGHLEVTGDPTAPVATIDLWAAADASPWPRPDNPWGRLVFDPQRRFVHDWRPRSDAVLDVEGRSIVACFPDPAALTLDERAKPLHRLIGGLLSRWGAAMVHGALVADADRAVLIVGAGGSGKSTTALAARMAGLDYLGDDYVGLAAPDGVAIGYSLFASGLVGTGPLDRLPAADGLFADAASLPDEAKKLIYLTDGMRREARIAAVLLPQVGRGAATALAPAGMADFLLAAAPHSLLANAQDRGVALDVMDRVGSLVPVWRASLGHDMAGVVAALRTVAARPDSE